MALSGPPLDVAKSDIPSIPLCCIICPTAPGFSDLSHFLTHVSSKSHLWHVHQVDIASYSDQDAERKLRQWHEYYARHNVRRLEHDRQGAKGKKKLLERGMTPARGYRARHNADMDGIKIEPDDSILTTSSSMNWSNGSTDSSHHSHLYGIHHDFGYAVSRTETPTYSETDISQMTEGASATISDTVMDGLDEIGGVLEERELKGLKLPGMRCFDSASPIRKKKRNQKKSQAATEQLERDSSSVDSTYMVWEEVGDDEPQRQGDVYDAASVDGSPERSLNREGPKRRRGRRPAAGQPRPGTPQRTRTPQPTRSSARIAKKRAEDKIPANYSDPPYNQDEEGEQEEMKSEMSRYDSANRGRQRLASQGLHGIADRTASPVESFHGLLRRASVLQPMMTNGNMNGNLNSPPTRLIKHNTMSFFNQRDHGSSFPSRSQALSRSPMIRTNSPALISRSSAVTHLSPMDLQNHHMNTPTHPVTGGVSPHALSFSPAFPPVTSHPPSSVPSAYYSAQLGSPYNPLWQPATNGYSTNRSYGHFGVEDRPSGAGYENASSIIQPLPNSEYSSYPNSYVTSNSHQMQRDQDS